MPTRVTKALMPGVPLTALLDSALLLTASVTETWGPGNVHIP